jgi:pimeloyl-ACP methyl ester carboxylesterase
MPTGNIRHRPPGDYRVPSAGDLAMSTITARDGAEISYKDMETGQPIMFHHGWPLTADDWDG